MLEAAGIRTESGLLEAQARELNRGFLSRIERGRPFVRLKCAASLDGKTALSDGSSFWITGEALRHPKPPPPTTGCVALNANHPNSHTHQPLYLPLPSYSPVYSLYLPLPFTLNPPPNFSYPLSDEQRLQALNAFEHIRIIRPSEHINGRINLLSLMPQLAELGFWRSSGRSRLHTCFSLPEG